MRNDYIVIINSVVESTFTIQDANSSEEAESIAEGLLRDGSEGDKEVLDTFVVESFPVEATL